MLSLKKLIVLSMRYTVLPGQLTTICEIVFWLGLSILFRLQILPGWFFDCILHKNRLAHVCVYVYGLFSSNLCVVHWILSLGWLLIPYLPDKWGKRKLLILFKLCYLELSFGWRWRKPKMLMVLVVLSYFKIEKIEKHCCLEVYPHLILIPETLQICVTLAAISH